MRSFLASAVFAAAVMAGSGLPASAAEFEWNHYASVPQAHDVGKIVVKGFDRIRERTNGRLDIKYIFYGETPYKPPEGPTLIRDGLVQMTEWLPAYSAGTYPLLSGPELPLIEPSYVSTPQLHEQAEAAWQTPTLKAFEEGLLDQHGAMRITRVFYEPMNLWFKDGFSRYEDLQGKKIRAFSPEQAEFIRAVGATPVNVAGPEVYTALQRGLVDGTVIGSSAIVSFKLDEVIKTGLITNLQLLSTGILASKRSVEALPEDVRAIFLEEMAAVQEESRAFIPEQELKDLAMLQEKGIEIVRPSEDLYRQLHEVAKQSVWPEWAKRAGKDGDAFLTETASAKK